MLSFSNQCILLHPKHVDERLERTCKGRFDFIFSKWVPFWLNRRRIMSLDQTSLLRIKAEKTICNTLVLAVVFYGFIVSCDLLLIYFHKWMDSNRNVHNFSFCIRKLWPGSESFKDYQSQYGVFSDTDECVTEKQNCSANAVCSNVNGSYKRECKTGYFGDGWTCEGNVVKHCELN